MIHGSVEIFFTNSKNSLQACERNGAREGNAGEKKKKMENHQSREVKIASFLWEKEMSSNRKKDNHTQESTDTLTVSISETSENAPDENWPL